MLLVLNSLLLVGSFNERSHSASAVEHFQAGCFETKSIPPAKAYFTSNRFQRVEDERLEEVNVIARSLMPSFDTIAFVFETQDSFFESYIVTNVGPSRFGNAEDFHCTLWEHGAMQPYAQDRISGFFGQQPFDTWSDNGKLHARWIREDERGAEVIRASYQPCSLATPEQFCGNSYSFEQTKAVD